MFAITIRGFSSFQMGHTTKSLTAEDSVRQEFFAKKEQEMKGKHRYKWREEICLFLKAVKFAEFQEGFFTS